MAIERIAIVAGLLLSASLMAQQPALTADQILDKYVEAVGGAAKLDVISTWHETTEVTGDLDALPPFRTPTPSKSRGTGEFFFKAPMLRVSWVRNDKNVFVVASGCDGKESWMYTPRLRMYKRKLTPDIEDTCKLGMTLPMELRRKNAKLEMKGPKEVAGRTTFVIHAEEPGDRSLLLYIDSETYLLLRLDAQTLVPHLGVRRVTHLYSDYRDVAGIKVAFQREVHTDNADQILKVRDVQVNVPIDDKVFQRPNW